jgi:starch-binding outer membrane protein, SusD/RagB family
MLRYKQLNMWMAAVLAVSLFTSCKKNFTDPNRATSDKVFASPAGLTGVSIGLQRVYSLGRASSLYKHRWPHC